MRQSSSEIIGIIHSNDISAETTIQQSNTWESEVQILKDQLCSFSDGRIIFEYAIPRMGKRVDAVVLFKNIVFLLELKCGDTEYRQSTYDQVYDYALDLRNFQKESHDKLLVPIMVSTRAAAVTNVIRERDRVIEPLRCNVDNIADVINMVASRYAKSDFNYVAWENSEYLPTPTIVEAAQALYRGHNVHDITRSDAGAENLTVTTDEINRIIEHSKANGRKSICFVTGVPGAGKTLVGLNIAFQRSNAQQGEHAVFLSGNFPLVTVLQEALARDKVEQEKQRDNRVSKADALRSTSAFIQIIHKYRDSFVGNNNIPPERVAIFDEAQRAWTQDMIEKFMAAKKSVPNFPYSEPEFLISTMDRHKDWAVVICLVGGGQEINTGEAGLPEWFDSLRRTFPDWDVYLTPQLNDDEYRRGRSWSSMLEGLRTFERDELHLATSVCSFRTPDLAAFVKAVLDADTAEAKLLYQRIKDKYPIVITRDLNKAKDWVRDRCQGTTRYGLLASSGALRLKPEGIFVKNEISVFEHLQRKIVDTTIHTLLKMSRLPLKDPKTFENFDFSVIKGRDANRLKTLPSLSAIYAHRNLAFIGPAGTGKTHLAQAFGYECCQRGIKTYFIKMSELRDKFTAARRAGKEASVLNGLVRPSCLIIDEVGHCEFDKENTRLFFDLIDRRYNKEGNFNIVFTSNKHPSHWRSNFNEDDALLCALDRIFDDATVFNIKGESFRGKKLETVALQTSRVKAPDSSETPTL